MTLTMLDDVLELARIALLAGISGVIVGLLIVFICSLLSRIEKRIKRRLEQRRTENGQ